MLVTLVVVRLDVMPVSLVQPWNMLAMLVTPVVVKRDRLQSVMFTQPENIPTSCELAGMLMLTPSARRTSWMFVRWLYQGALAAAVMLPPTAVDPV